ncbi:MAG: zinc ABC transporter substrate-binding protein [Actinobacteria bacterium]|nr:zinc ABC transporter substrate-binding protein [Actinomycetota bacterium]
MRTIIISSMRRSPSRSLLALVPLSLVGLTACGSDDTTSGRPTVVTTTAILGAVVSDVVGDAAEVVVLVPNGVDPHDWEPSAQDIESLNQADLVVANGLDLEEKLVEALDSAESSGAPVFHATDHIQPLEGDPHFWTDPLAMAAVVAALGDQLAAIGVDLSDRVDRVITDLKDVDGVITQLLSSLPEDRRVLVTGHDSLGYFAEHFGFTLVGSIIPSLSSAADVTAQNLSEMKAAIDETGAPVIFTELGTPTDVADALADETGTRVVELATHLVPDDGLYRSFLLNLASDIVAALSATS